MTRSTKAYSVSGSERVHDEGNREEEKHEVQRFVHRRTGNIVTASINRNDHLRGRTVHWLRWSRWRMRGGPSTHTQHGLASHDRARDPNLYPSECAVIFRNEWNRKRRRTCTTGAWEETQPNRVCVFDTGTNGTRALFFLCRNSTRFVLLSRSIRVLPPHLCYLRPNSLYVLQYWPWRGQRPSPLLASVAHEGMPVRQLLRDKYNENTSNGRACRKRRRVGDEK